jgi:choline/carnitine/betaine transport
MLKTLHDKLGLRTDPIIFFVSAVTVIGFVLVTAFFTEWVNDRFESMSNWILENLGWFFILGVTSFLIFLFWIAISRYGNVRLGGPDARPEFSNGSWFAMLFAAGIGTILMFFGVAEPITHYADPPLQDAEPGTPAAASEAMGFTLYHYGLHTWAIFCVPALAFAYFVYKRGLPMRVSSVFHPILGDKIHGPIGKVIDVLAVIGTIFGVAVSIGLGTFQINSGLQSLFGVPFQTWVQVAIIAIITAIAVGSIVLGLDKGVKRLSNINIVMAIGLMVFVFVTAASPLFLAKGTVQTTGDYLSQLPPLAFWNDAFGANPGWLGDNTVTIWAWTISWAPFVGIFIARISKGRTIREFVGGVLGLPTAFTIVWFSVFGLSAIDIENRNPGQLTGPVVDEGDRPGALFAFLEEFPIATALMAFSVLIVVIFFTTSKGTA